MTRVDEAAFTRVLKAAFPDIRFIDGQRWWKPGIPWIDSIDQRKDTLVYGFLPEGDELPKKEKWFRNSYTIALPRRNFQFDRSVWDWTRPNNANWAWDPPTLTTGRITSTYRRDDAEDKYFINRLFRLLRKVTVNAFLIENPHRGIVLGEKRDSDFWAGHDALRWCGEAPARMLGGFGRPHPDWSFPEDNPYYQSLGVFGRPTGRQTEGAKA